jgi:hypothetical protein
MRTRANSSVWQMRTKQIARAIVCGEDEQIAPQRNAQQEKVAGLTFAALQLMAASQGPSASHMGWPKATGGFYHDGRFPQLSDVVAHYDRTFNLALGATKRVELVELLKSL